MQDISAFSEFELIAHLTRFLPTRSDVHLGAGDDCAILDIGSEMLLLATCDSQVEGVHYTLQTYIPEQIGRKALAINLSDIAAMGGEPRFALISLILPPHLPLPLLEGIYAGLQQEAERTGTALVGGNIASTGQGEKLIIDITLLGTVERGHVLKRSGAQVGDTLLVTGFPGNSAAGLHTLLSPSQAYPQAAQEIVRASHRTPQPRINEGRILSQFGPNIVTSLLDISDGISGDLSHICERSNVGAQLNIAQVPLSPALLQIAQSAEQDPLHWVLHGGEDYELLFTVSPGYETTVIGAIEKATGTPVTAIGSILPPEERLQIIYPDGRQDVLQIQSWDHLKKKE